MMMCGWSRRAIVPSCFAFQNLPNTLVYAVQSGLHILQQALARLDSRASFLGLAEALVQLAKLGFGLGSFRSATLPGLLILV